MLLLVLAVLVVAELSFQKSFIPRKTTVVLLVRRHNEGLMMCQKTISDMHTHTSNVSQNSRRFVLKRNGTQRDIPCVKCDAD